MKNDNLVIIMSLLWEHILMTGGIGAIEEVIS